MSKEKKTPATTEEMPARGRKTKGRKRKLAGKILLSILGVIVAFVLVTMVITLIGNSANLKKAQSFSPVEYDEQLVPEKDAEGNYVFTTDRELKIVQLTDVHIGGGWMSLKKDGMALNAVAAMITAEKPDLVVVTGDIAYPVPFQAGTFNNKNGARIFANLMDSLGVYWTFAFGNHDTEAYSYFDRVQISAFYDGNFEYCLFNTNPEGVEIDGYGNQVINVMNTKGEYVQSIYMLDTGSYVDGDILGILWKYDTIHDNQCDWYKSCVEKYNAKNAAIGAGEVKSIAFFHMPVQQYKTAWREYAENGFENTENTTYIYGTAGEKGRVVYCGQYDSNFFSVCDELGSTQALFCGHDHYNNFSLDYKGENNTIRLTYGLSIDYLAYAGIYKIGSQRGCTVITINTDGSFECSAENYYQDKYTTLYDKENVEMQKVEPVTVFDD